MIFIPSQHLIEQWAKYNVLVAEYNVRFGHKSQVGHIEDYEHWATHYKYIKWSLIHKILGMIIIEN